MNVIERKQKIAASIRSFSEGNLSEKALNLFESLGYNTERQLSLDKPDYASFKNTFLDFNSIFSEAKAIVNDWIYVDLIFQLTSSEMKTQKTFFEEKVERNDPASYLFFIIELSGNDYSKSQLAQISREINKKFLMHVFVLFKYANRLTFSLIDRRQNKKVLDKDVIEKVTHLYNISIDKPHSAHIQILYTFSLDSITAESPKKSITNFGELQSGWRKVISTDILNKQFYLEYSKLSVKLIKAIYPKQVNNKLIAHQGVLNLLNRIMFLYFVQKKEWIMRDENFIIHFWKDYLNTEQKNQFHEKWLNSILFYAFNGIVYKSPKVLKALPEPYKSEVINFPYLNGGLFAWNDEYDNFLLNDESFQDIFKFFESYIFTISEDTPYEVNLEINPDLLGKMYEGMINATDLDDVEAEHGIIYTERPEINFMSRRSFVDVLDNKLNGEFSREFLYHFVFDEPDQKYEILKRYKVNANTLRKAIISITACDPACGSGSMLLGVIQLQMELIRVLDSFEGNPHTPNDDFYIKKQLISECLYGVDIKEWAVRIAELRLWLYMISEAEFSEEQLTKSPLLPNLDFKLRSGNSLLQKFGTLDFTLEELLKGRKKNAGATKNLNNFIKRKKEFIVNQEKSNTTYKELKAEEYSVFKRFIDELIIDCDIKLKNVGKRGTQEKMFVEVGQSDLDLNLVEKEKLQNEIEQLKKLKANIKKEKRLPFSYDIDFMEVFLTSDDAGFDLIIGNPPYVRQEEILPPEDGEYLEYLLDEKNKLEKAKVSKVYKEELNAKIYKTYPFLATDIRTPIEGKTQKVFVYGSKVPGRSDLYSYFQLLCPAYLNKKGTFCFIISNSWLDTEFGSYVQQFLLKHTCISTIYDCTTRSFDAKVNTIIYLHSALKNIESRVESYYKILEPINNTVRFIMNKIDYSQAAYAPLLLEQENCKKNTFKDLYRVIVLTQKELFDLGYDENTKEYIGDKWGGKWLYSPEIYFDIIDKGAKKTTKIKNIISYSQRNTTEAFEYFTEVNSRRENDIPYLDTSKILSKIYHKPSEIIHSIKRRDSKFKKGIKHYKIPDVISNRFIGERIFFVEGDDYVVGDTFFVAEFKEKNKKEFYLACMNSTLCILNVLVTGRKNMGDGVLLFYGPEFTNLQLFLPENNKSKILKVYGKMKRRNVGPIYEELGFDRDGPIRDQQPNPSSDRKELDNIIFDELNLSQLERNEVYWSVGELAKQRFDKAGSR